MFRSVYLTNASTDIIRMSLTVIVTVLKVAASNGMPLKLSRDGLFCEAKVSIIDT